MEKREEVLACVAEWKETLRKCQYAGEVHLDPERLVRLARDLGSMNPDDALYETGLLVLAVNCAYHYYDDEGFWPHFCRLFNIECTAANQQRIGHIIERQIDLLGLKRTMRTGPFRYVGAILEQCGVSKRYIAALAGIIKETKRHLGSWDALFIMGEQEFRNRLNTVNCSRYLKDFLLDTAGWEFTLQVCELLMLYEQGDLTLADLKELPGYQPGFWDDFVARFHQAREAGQRTGLALRPRLLFVPERRCLAIRFPDPDCADGVRHPAIPGFWQFPITLLNRDDAWSEYYAGATRALDGQLVEWALSGWLPDGLPAVFDLKRGFLRHGCRVAPGEYYLLLPDGDRPSCDVVSELGPVHVPGNTPYRAYRVVIKPGTRISGYERAHDPQKDIDISISWVKPEDFRLWCSDPDVDVFSGSLPDLAVSDFRPITEHRAAMFYTAGPLSGRIRDSDDLERALKEIEKCAPVAGRFYVLAIGRSGRAAVAPVLSELEFYLLPKLDVKFSRRIYAFDEEPVIEINRTFPGRLHLEDCHKLDSGGRKWAVPVRVKYVNGVVECQNVVAGIRIPVNRTCSYSLDGNPVRYLMKTEPDKETVFLLTGCPDSEAFLGLYQGPTGHIRVKFDAGGSARVRWDHILRLVNDHECSICEIVLTTGDHMASTGMVVIDFPSISDSICAGAGYQACVCTAKNLTRVLDVCTQICQGVPAGRCFNLTRLPRFHPVLDEWVFSIFTCAEVFDEVNVLVGGQKSAWTEKIVSEDLRLILDFVREGRLGRWTGNRPPDRKEMLPPVWRWREAFERLLHLFMSGGEMRDLAKWAGEIRRHQTRFRSEIALMPGGHTLSSAWVCYHRGLFESALSFLNRLGEAPPVVTALSDFLRILLLLRLGRIGASRQVAESARYDGNLQPAFLLLQYVLRTLSGENASPAPQMPLTLLAELPLRAEDRRFLAAASEKRNTTNETEDDSSECDDWLLLFFLATLTPASNRKAEIARRLVRIKDSIPASPEKTAILERLAGFREVK